MKKQNQQKSMSKIKWAIVLIASVVGASLLYAVPNAWSAIEFIKPNDSAEQIIQATSFIKFNTANHSHAPEPSTLALLGSAILSMVLGFVRRTYTILKRAIDVVGSIIGLVFTAPVLIFTALLIKLTSPGPIIYSQVRVGKDGQEFNIYKFRTMRVDAEKYSGPVWAKKNDNRLTPIGGFLRKTRIDEIPQFINVLKGEMSIIGPRPERPMFVEQFKEQIPGYAKRLDVKPGITGMAQVWHRYDETIEDVKTKITYDVQYIQKLSLWTDLHILLHTVRVVLTGAGAK